MANEVPMPLRIAASIAMLLIASLSMMALPAGNPEASLDETLHTLVRGYSVESENLLQALAKFSDDFQVPIGVEWRSLRCPLSQLSSGSNRRRFSRSSRIWSQSTRGTLSAGRME